MGEVTCGVWGFDEEFEKFPDLLVVRVASPQAIERYNVDSVLEGVSALSEVQRVSSSEVLSDCFAQFLQGLQLVTGDPASGLDLKPHYTAVVEFDYQVNFQVVMRSPVADPRDLRAPGGLLQQFANGKGLQEVAEFGLRGRVERGELLWRDSHQPSSNRRVEDVDLR